MINVEKFEKIIEENKDSMEELWALYTMSQHENYSMLSKDEKEKLLALIFNLWFEIDDTNFERISDIVIENYEKALNNELTKDNISIYM